MPWYSRVARIAAWNMAVRIFFWLFKDHPIWTSVVSAMSGIISYIVGLDWPVWFFGGTIVVCVGVGIRQYWISQRSHSPDHMGAFSNIPQDLVRQLEGALRIAKEDRTDATLRSLRGTFQGIKRELSQAGIQTPPVPTLRHRDDQLSQWKHVCDLLQETVGRRSTEFNDWHFVMTQSKKLVGRNK